jgi:hypothetical protein
MMMPTAMSSTFPRMANSLNSFNMVRLLLSYVLGLTIAPARLKKQRGSFVVRIISEAK